MRHRCLLEDVCFHDRLGDAKNFGQEEGLFIEVLPLFETLIQSRLFESQKN